jgi:NADP-dependent 3-hydroxy acid dehydrogenase YdfG
VTQPLEGTVALVTGASSGIGQATARALAGQGAAIALVARRADRLEALAEELGDGLVVAADLTDRARAVEAVERVIAERGRLDILLNAAGVMLNGPIVDAPVEEWDRMVEINVRGLLYVCHAALPHLLRAAAEEPRHVADLVNVSSIAGRFANRGAGVYNATKFGVNAFSESLRQEVTKRHVRVCVIEPGAVETELFGHQRPEIQDYYEDFFAEVEKLDADDIARGIVYAVTQPQRVDVNEVLIRPTGQRR